MCVDYDTRVAKHCREPTAEEVQRQDARQLLRSLQAARQAPTRRPTSPKSTRRNPSSKSCSANAESSRALTDAAACSETRDESATRAARAPTDDRAASRTACSSEPRPADAAPRCRSASRRARCRSRGRWRPESPASPRASSPAAALSRAPRPAACSSSSAPLAPPAPSLRGCGAGGGGGGFGDDGLASSNSLNSSTFCCVHALLRERARGRPESLRRLRAALLLRAHRHHGDAREFRAHVVRHLLRGDRVREEAEPQAIPLAAFAAAFHRVERVGTEDGERRHLVELHRLHGPVQLHGERHRRVLLHRFLQRATRLRVIGLQQRDAGIRIVADALAVFRATVLENLEDLRIRERRRQRSAQRRARAEPVLPEAARAPAHDRSTAGAGTCARPDMAGGGAGTCARPAGGRRRLTQSGRHAHLARLAGFIQRGHHLAHVRRSARARVCCAARSSLAMGLARRRCSDRRRRAGRRIGARTRHAETRCEPAWACARPRGGVCTGGAAGCACRLALHRSCSERRGTGASRLQPAAWVRFDGTVTAGARGDSAASRRGIGRSDRAVCGGVAVMAR